MNDATRFRRAITRKDGTVDVLGALRDLQRDGDVRFGYVKDHKAARFEDGSVLVFECSILVFETDGNGGTWAARAGSDAFEPRQREERR